ncbi:hypothetical protein INS49_010298 [Diaporthe citri]|uniref:uncharacterized protein n=1 Tax=Diaporthe citri TaxID=83186 RepID=UPI001C7E6574|nr:uncharacterized protein INS49_010298 [Diaporthe citri]KAG6362069.1 hypothetical protein INS49_010298 [Diaporthe citri]
MGRIDFARARKSGHRVRKGHEEKEEEEGDEVENEGSQWKRQEEDEEETETVGGFNVQAVRINQDSGL